MLGTKERAGTGQRWILVQVPLLAWNEWQGVFFRLAEQLRRPLRC